MTQRLTPIFVLGSARSGTTWLSNLLAAHPAIAAAQHVVHWGCLESEMYQYARHAGDLRDEGRFVRFLETFAATDLFRVLEGDKEKVYRTRPTDMYDLLFGLFDDFALRHGTSFWTTKLDPALLYRPTDLEHFMDRLTRRYRGAKWIGITRGAHAVVASYLRMESRRSIRGLGRHVKALATVLEAGRYVAHNRGMDELLASRRGLRLSFEELRADEAAVRARLSSYLGLDLSPARSAYLPNTSHRDGRPDATTEVAARIADRVLVPAFQRAPGLARGIVRLRDLSRGDHSPFYWRVQQLERSPEALQRELEQTGQTALRRALFG